MLGFHAMGEAPVSSVGAGLILPPPLSGSQPLAWILDTRPVDWSLVARDTIWNIPAPENTWNISLRS